MASGNPASRSHLRAECGWRPTAAKAPDTALPAALPVSSDYLLGLMNLAL